MKKFRLLAAFAVVLTVFGACTKDELKTSQDEGILKAGKIVDVYLEGDYLVVKNFEAVDSLKKTLQNKSLEEQSSWENQFGLKSAKTFRAQASDKMAGFTTEQQAETYARKLVNEGYFSMRDSSICYPFYNYSWDCILNKNGVIKIGSVLYCFQKDAQISIMDGKAKTLNQFLSNPESCDTTLVKVYSFSRLKSTTPTSYGTVASSRMYSAGGGVRWDLSFCYDKVTSQIPVPPGGGLITVQTGLHYYLYFHEQKKRLFGWSDDADIFYYQHVKYDFGGNYDPYQGVYITPATNMTQGLWQQLNNSALANVYVDIHGWLFSGALSPIPSSYPGSAPVINTFSGNGRTDYISDILNLTIN